MRVDFYQLTRDPAERLVPVIAARVLAGGGRLCCVAPAARHRALSDALWDAGEDSFLAHGIAGGATAALDPILLAEAVTAENGADHVLISDGQWRDPGKAVRTFFLFAPDGVEAARAAWRELGRREDVERHFWVQDGGRWREGP